MTLMVGAVRPWSWTSCMLTTDLPSPTASPTAAPFWTGPQPRRPHSPLCRMALLTRAPLPGRLSEVPTEIPRHAEERIGCPPPDPANGSVAHGRRQFRQQSLVPWSLLHQLHGLF